jgi:ATP-dependent DNA ligase
MFQKLNLSVSIFELNEKQIFDKEEVSDFILDCEAVAYDRETQKIKPFQVLSTRARKVIIDKIRYNLCEFVFCLLPLSLFLSYFLV